MFHLAAYAAAIGSTADTDVTAVVDDILTIQNSHFVLSQEMMLLSAMAMSATLTRAKIASPSMRQIASPFIRPIVIAAIPPANPNMALFDYSPFRIPPFEEIQVQASAAPAMTEPFAALLWLASGLDTAPRGNIIPLRFTSTTAAVANTWTTLTITFADTLPSGVYTMVLSEMSSTNARAHRWIVPNQLYRPGYPSYASVGSRHPYAISKSQFGMMGSFRSNDLPRPQVLANGADATHEGYLWVVRTGNL